MAKTTKTKIENVVKTLTNDSIKAIAQSVRAVSLLIDKATLEVNKKKDELCVIVKAAFKETIKATGEAVGTYQIPVDDEGNIVEIPISCLTTPLTALEHEELGKLPGEIFSALFEDCEEIIEVTDSGSLMVSLMGHANLNNFISVSGGTVTVKCSEVSLSGIKTGTFFYPKDKFVARVNAALANFPHTEEDTDRLVTWFMARSKPSIRIGNRIATTTT
jgi:hypothetical protein